MKPSLLQQRAIRLSVVVLTACFLGYGVILPEDRGIQVDHRKVHPALKTALHKHPVHSAFHKQLCASRHDRLACPWLQEWSQGFKWAAITCVSSGRLASLLLKCALLLRRAGAEGAWCAQVVVQAPVIGKLAQVGGYAAADQLPQQPWVGQQGLLQALSAFWVPYWGAWLASGPITSGPKSGTRSGTTSTG